MPPASVSSQYTRMGNSNAIARYPSTLRSRATDSWSCAMELAVEKRTSPWRHGDVRTAHPLKSKVPAAADPQALGGLRAVRPGVEGAVGHHRHRKAHGLQGGDKEVAPGLELGAAAFV